MILKYPKKNPNIPRIPNAHLNQNSNNPKLSEKSEFSKLFDEYFRKGYGRPPKGDTQIGFWVANEFINELGKYKCNKSVDALETWKKGKVLPQESTFEAILRVFCSPISLSSVSQTQLDERREKLRHAYDAAKAKQRAERVRKRNSQDQEPAAETAAELGTARPLGPIKDDRAGRAAEDPHQTEHYDRQEDERKLRKLKSIVADILSESGAAMDALASEIAIARASRSSAADHKPRAEILIECLMEAKFKNSLDWLTAAHRKLDQFAAMEVIEKIGQHILPFLFVIGAAPGPGALAQSSNVAMIPIRIGLESFSEIVMAGIAMRRVQFSRNKMISPNPRFPVSEYALHHEPNSGPHIILQNMRKQLEERLGLGPIYEGRPKTELDAGIRASLATRAKDENVRFYCILELPDAGPERDRVLAVWEEVVKFYEYLAIVELDRNLVSGHQPLFEKLRRLFGLLEQPAA